LSQKLTTNEYQDVLNQYAAAQEATPPIVENEPQPTTTFTDLGISEKPPQNNIFKIIFIISLIIFVLTATILAFVYFKNQNNSTTSTSTNYVPQNNSASQNTPTPTITGTCFLNDKTYQIGDSFAASDGCNICTCKSQNNISCSDNQCLSSKSSTESATITPAKTNSASTSAKKTISTSSASTK
jgi:hypothetical protein